MAFILGVRLQDLEHHIFDFRSRPEDRKLELSQKPNYSPMQRISLELFHFGKNNKSREKNTLD